MNEIVRHRIVDVSGLLGKDRTPWGSIRSGLRDSAPSHSAENLHARSHHPAFSNRPPAEPVAPKPAVCDCADVRAWLGPRRVGARPRL